MRPCTWLPKQRGREFPGRTFVLVCSRHVYVYHRIKGNCIVYLIKNFLSLVVVSPSKVVRSYEESLVEEHVLLGNYYVARQQASDSRATQLQSDTVFTHGIFKHIFNICVKNEALEPIQVILIIVNLFQRGKTRHII